MEPGRERPPGEGKASASPWSLPVATVAGIPVRLHFTFLLFLFWIYIISRGRGAGSIIVLILGVFFCVVLHEFGHALVARKCGIKTKDITLYPIGGVASIQGRPKPAQELWIALAGPAVNVAIALLLIPVSLMAQGRPPNLTFGILGRSLIDDLFSANVFLPLFNMVPAFPMDGGRVLRAFLAMNISEVRATQIAGTIGQFLAIAFGIYALYDKQILWMLVAFFVFIGAGQEMASTIGYSLMAGRRVRDATQIRFRTVDSGSSLARAAQMLLEGSQQDFPVVAGSDVIGVLTRADIAKGLAGEGPEAYVAKYTQRDFKRIGPDEPLEKVMELFAEDRTPALVFEGDQLIGMITGENLSEFIMLQHAIQQAHART